MMRRVGLIVILGLLPVIGGGGAMAQGADECPKALRCVEYDGETYEIDPADGPVVLFVVETRETTVERLDGTSTERSVRAVVIVDAGDGYEVVGVTDRLTPAQNAEAELDEKLIPRIDRRDD